LLRVWRQAGSQRLAGWARAGSPDVLQERAGIRFPVAWLLLAGREQVELRWLDVSLWVLSPDALHSPDGKDSVGFLLPACWNLAGTRAWWLDELRLPGGLSPVALRCGPVRGCYSPDLPAGLRCEWSGAARLRSPASA